MVAMNAHLCLSQTEKRIRQIGVVSFVLTMCCFSSFGQFGEPDKFIEGKVLDKLRGDVELWPIVDVARFVREPISESVQTWLEDKFVAGTSPYYFKYNVADKVTDGYCLAKDGIVVSSFLLEKNCVQLPAVKYTLPSTLQVDVKAEPTQPAGCPVLLALTLTNQAKIPFKYYSGGPGDYPSATLFTAEVTNAAKQTQEIELENGQTIYGRVHSYDLDPGQTLTVPASAGVLPAGSYRIKVGDGKIALVSVENSAELEKTRTEKVINGIRGDNAFLEFITTHYNLQPVFFAFSTADMIAAVRNGNSFFQKLVFDRKIQPVMEALEADLTSTDTDMVSRAAGTILLYGNPPTYFTEGITKAMQRQLDDDGGNAQLESTLAWLASEIGSDDAMIPVLNLLHSKTVGLNEESRADVVTCLAEFKQERATDELRQLLKAPELKVRTVAALALVQRKDPAGLEVLITEGMKPDPFKRPDLYDALLNFPDDPKVEAAIKRGLDDEDAFVRHQADGAFKALHALKLVKSHGVNL